MKTKIVLLDTSSAPLYLRNEFSKFLVNKKSLCRYFNIEDDDEFIFNEIYKAVFKSLNRYIEAIGSIHLLKLSDELNSELKNQRFLKHSLDSRGTSLILNTLGFTKRKRTTNNHTAALISLKDLKKMTTIFESSKPVGILIAIKNLKLWCKNHLAKDFFICNFEI